MDENISFVKPLKYDSYPHNKQYESYNKNGNQSERRKVVGSPEGIINQRIISPVISPLINQKNINKEIFSSSTLANNSSSSYHSYLNTNTDDNFKQKKLSPFATEVSMPGGFTYVIDEEKINSNKKISNSTLTIQQPLNESNLSRKSNHSQFFSHKQNRNRKSKYNGSDSDSDLSFESESESRNSNKSKESKKRRMKEREREKEKQRNKLVDLLLEDYVERKKKEKEKDENEEVKRKSQSKMQTPSKINPGFEKPTSREHIAVKSKIPNYEEYSDIDKDKIKEKFRNNYNILISKYPKWKIEIPDFDLLPLRIIHERYETVVRTICIYQTGMKWKVYLIIIIAGIEYYGYNVKKYTFLKGLLKEQIKSVHKYDNYLVEFAEMFFSDEVGDDYPIWIRFLGTFASSLGCFSSINGIVKLLGKDTSAPEFVFEQADRFVSPPEGTAKLHSDGISDVPDVPSGLQDSNTLIGVIGNLFGMFTNNPQNAVPQNAVPISSDLSKPKIVDDYENADF